MLDLTKAFDTLDHTILETKLNHIGIRGITLKWFTSYLSNRHQYTVFKSSSSRINNLTCGVPQGSILGPLLFLIYINDIVNNLTHSNAIIYADDTNLIFHDKDLNKVIDSMNAELNAIETWFNANMLSININKTSYVIFHPKNKPIPTHKNISMGRKNINRLTAVKFLGVTIDEQLNWKSHLTNKSNQIVKVVSILSRLKHSISTTILKKIYDALILPHMSYAISAWGNIRNREMTRLITLQKKAVRIFNKSKYNAHTSPLFRKLLKAYLK